MAVSFTGGSSACGRVKVVEEEPCRTVHHDDEVPCGRFERVLGTTEGFVLRGRIVFDETDDPPAGRVTPWDDVTEDEIDHARVALRIVSEAGEVVHEGTLRADEEGWISAAIDLRDAAPAAGRYRARISYEGHLAANLPVRLLAADDGGLAVRSDVDLTYLVTDFHSPRAMLELLREDSGRKVTLPAMEVVYKALRAGASGREDRPLTFLSGSPNFFRRTLEAKLEADGVEQDGLVLKPMKEMAAALLLSGRADEVVPALEDQVGYKLAVLLERRLELPPGTGELLFGDDSEADHVVYALYHRLTSGALSPADLDRILGELGVDRSWREAVAARAPAALAKLGGAVPVRGIWIHATDRPGARFPVADWIVPGLTVHHTGAAALVGDLHAKGLVSEAAVVAVEARLAALGHSED